ncbi:MAG: prolyl oligopeptidase family serine peptidase [Clostridia bacterium]|nr:prolyl oligopeptidase family serine peptidase [Clostridia bacterium]
MEKIINEENLRRFAYHNGDCIKGPIKAVAVFFVGLGGSSMYDNGNEWGESFAKQGVLFVIPYHNPWAWMNRQTVEFTDEIIDVLFKKYDLCKETPIVACGGSMGGQGALVYTAYSKRTPERCVASCPVCDLPYHFTERPDLPRTLYTAFASYEGTLEDALRSASPIHLADKMPQITKYHIFHCEKDEAVNIDKHSRPFVELMEKDHNVTLYSVPDRTHCDLDEYHSNLFDELIIDAAKKDQHIPRLTAEKMISELEFKDEQHRANFDEIYKRLPYVDKYRLCSAYLLALCKGAANKDFIDKCYDFEKDVITPSALNGIECDKNDRRILETAATLWSEVEYDITINMYFMDNEDKKYVKYARDIVTKFMIREINMKISEMYKEK